MNKITSLTNPKIKELVKLKDKKYRDEKGLFIIEGEDIVLEAKKNNLLELILTSDEKYKDDIEIIYVTDAIINKLASTKTPQGLIGICKIPSTSTILTNKVILLDGLQDPSNVGAIIRSAKAFGFNTLMLTNDTVDIYNEKLIRSSKGYSFSMNIIKDDIKGLLSLLKKEKYYVVTSALKNAKSLNTLEKKEKIAIIIGNEGRGVSTDSINAADIVVKIDMNEEVESLNASVAAAILMHKIYNK